MVFVWQREKEKQAGGDGELQWYAWLYQIN